MRRQVIEDSTQGKPRPVIKLAHNDTIADALSILAEHRILSAPVRTTRHVTTQPVCRQPHNAQLL